jgi:hypothetical protein
MKNSTEKVVLSLENYLTMRNELEALQKENRTLTMERDILKEGENGVQSYVVQMPTKFWDSLAGRCDVQINVKNHAVQASLIQAIKESEKNVKHCQQLIGAYKVDIKELEAKVALQKGIGIYFPIWFEAGIVIALTALAAAIWH